MTEDGLIVCNQHTNGVSFDSFWSHVPPPLTGPCDDDRPGHKVTTESWGERRLLIKSPQNRKSL
jgi:hypothetical protein